MLTLTHKFNLRACGIRAATMEIIRRFCTKNFNFQFVRKGATIRHMPKLESKVRRVIELMDTDAAADERLAAESLGSERVGNVGVAATEADLPNLRATNVDKAHASRRLVSRTWKCDPELADIAKRFVLHKRSASKLIQNSEQNSARFQALIDTMGDLNETSSSVADMGSRNHRYDSHSKPFTRATLFFLPLVALLQEIVVQRKTTDLAREAMWPLSLVSTRPAILLSMLAAAGDKQLDDCALAGRRVMAETKTLGGSSTTPTT